MLAVQADGAQVRTVEALAGPDGTLSPLQRAFHEHHALQCGFCTPAFLMSLEPLLREEQHPVTEEAVREVVSGVLCRCTGYGRIVEAVSHALREAGSLDVFEARS
jgi:aerobic-type carbon monoxide dehydrogenase small subunit (CoxS/CutS family)